MSHNTLRVDLEHLDDSDTKSTEGNTNMWGCRAHQSSQHDVRTSLEYRGRMELVLNILWHSVGESATGTKQHRIQESADLRHTWRHIPILQLSPYLREESGPALRIHSCKVMILNLSVAYHGNHVIISIFEGQFAKRRTPNSGDYSPEVTMVFHR